MLTIGARRAALLGNQSIYAKVLAQLRRLGHALVIPGVGNINGFAAGTYTDSAGVTPAVRDDILGRWVDAGFGGIVFSQSATADKPRLNKRSNLLLKSEQLDDAVWAKTTTGTASLPVVTANAGLAPDGTLTADRVQMARNGGNASTDFPQIIQSGLSFATGVSYTMGFWVKAFSAGEVGKVIAFRGAAGAGFTTAVLTADWQLVQKTEVGNSVVVSAGISLRGGTGASDSADFLVARMQLNHGAALGRYQRVNTATDYDAEGFAYRVTFDGTDTMAATIPAGQGYDACTIIDATPSGPVTLTAQNIVGTYTMGPNLTTHGRIIARNGASLTAAELALYQAFATRLAGL